RGNNHPADQPTPPHLTGSLPAVMITTPTLTPPKWSHHTGGGVVPSRWRATVQSQQRLGQASTVVHAGVSFSSKPSNSHDDGGTPAPRGGPCYLSRSLLGR